MPVPHGVHPAGEDGQLRFFALAGARVSGDRGAILARPSLKVLPNSA